MDETRVLLDIRDNTTITSVGSKSVILKKSENFKN
jgi:hypothetical protein